MTFWARLSQEPLAPGPWTNGISIAGKDRMKMAGQGIRLASHTVVSSQSLSVVSSS